MISRTDREVGDVVVTASDDHAARVLEMHAVDYLVKPGEPERLEAGAKSAGPERVLVRQGSRVRLLGVDDIDYISAQEDRVLLRQGAEEYLKDRSLADKEAPLGPARFVSIHDDCLVNVQRLPEIEQNDAAAAWPS
jgi:two-component system, LytTR family, response regulator